MCNELTYVIKQDSRDITMPTVINNFTLFPTLIKYSIRNLFIPSLNCTV